MTQDPKLRGWGFLILRISVASMLATFHGWGKLSGCDSLHLLGPGVGFSTVCSQHRISLSDVFCALRNAGGVLWLPTAGIRPAHALCSRTHCHHYVSSRLLPFKNGSGIRAGRSLSCIKSVLCSCRPWEHFAGSTVGRQLMEKYIPPRSPTGRDYLWSERGLQP
jgi:hypothetical protein